MKRIRKAVLAILVNNENKILIGSSPRDGGYKFPQGGLEPNEDALCGIKRELKEELDITIVDADILNIYIKKVSYSYPKEAKYIFDRQELYVVKIRYHKDMLLIPQDDEFDKLLWIYPSELKNYNTYFRADAYQKALEMCGFIS